jgi:hypothetical protein
MEKPSEKRIKPFGLLVDFELEVGGWSVYRVRRKYRLREFVLDGIGEDADVVCKLEADDVILLLLHIRNFKVGHPVLSKTIEIA